MRRISAIRAAANGLRGAVKLTADGRILHGYSRCSPCSADEGSAGDLAPGLKGTVTGGTMLGGGQVVATELEEVVNLAVAGKEPLGMVR